MGLMQENTHTHPLVVTMGLYSVLLCVAVCCSVLQRVLQCGNTHTHPLFVIVGLQLGWHLINIFFGGCTITSTRFGAFDNRVSGIEDIVIESLSQVSSVCVLQCALPCVLQFVLQCVL